MSKPRFVCLKDYVAELLKTAEYKKDRKLDCVVAVVPLLPGCMTQGDNFEEARTNLIDAIDLWITVGLREGEDMPVVNGVQLAVAFEQLESPETVEDMAYAKDSALLEGCVDTQATSLRL